VLSPFTFGRPLETQPHARIAHVPAGIQDRAELYRILERDLRFPYFGHNWDALGELLSYGWDEPPRTSRIAIIHDDLPDLGPHHTGLPRRAATRR
jgi:hypothetical protein